MLARSWSLRSRLVGLVMMAFVPAFAVVGWSAYQARKAQVEKAYDHIGDLALATAIAQGRVIESARGLLAGLATSPDVRRGNHADCNAHFARLRSGLPDLANVGVADLEGVLRCSAVPVDRAINIADREYFRHTLQRNGFGVGGYHFGRATGQSSIGFGMAIHDAGGQPRGVAFAAFELGVLDRLMLEARAPAGALILIVDRHGLVLSSRPAGAQRVGEMAQDATLRRLLAADQPDARQTLEATGAGGAAWLIALAPVNVDGERVLTVAIGLPKRSVVGPIDRALAAQLLALAAVLLAALAAAWYGYERSIVRPVQTLLGAMRDVGRGRLEARAEWRSTVREFGEIKQAFNATVEALAARVDALERAEVALRASEERYRAVFELSPDAIFVHAEGRIVLMNHAGARMYGGAGPADMQGRAVLDLVDPEHQERVRQRLAQLETSSAPLAISEIAQRRLDGSRFIGEVYTTPFAGGAFVTEVRDVTERRRMEEALRDSEAQYRTLFEKSPIPMWVFSLRSLKFLAVNEAAVTHYGYSREEFLGMSVAQIRPPEDVDRFMVTLHEDMTTFRDAGLWRHRKKDGTLIDVHIDAYGIRFQGEDGRLVLATDVTERLRYEARIEYLATHDGLTDLPNRTLFADRLTQAISHARRLRQQVAVLVFDLDNFKIVNDSFGHAGGDEVLKGLARRLAELLRSGDTVARLGGDEFVILLTDLARPEDVNIVIGKIREALSRPFDVGGTEVFVSGSIGISMYPTDGEDVATLLRNADVAMYKVKEAGRDSAQYFTADLGTRATARVELEAGLRRALERGEFEIHYQPQVDLRTRRVVCAEALVRWRHPQDGLVAPARFIRVAEETGLIVPIGNWVLLSACAQLRAWQAAGSNGLRIAVNVSARQFRDKGLADSLREALRVSGLDPGTLEIELTEGLAMGNVEGFVAALAALKRLGIGIAIDDFGTGYSSLSYLKRFPVDKLKIDQSFVRGLPGNADDAAIAQTVIALGRSLGLTVTAEGVEALPQMEFLLAHGCDEAQGYYFGRPMAAAEFGRLLLSGGAAPGAAG